MDMNALRAKKGYICDMDGVIYHGNKLLPGVVEFVNWLQQEDKRFLFLTNNSGKAPKELQRKLSRMGLDIGEDHFYTSAQATATFLSQQCPGATAFVIGDAGLTNALYEKGITINDVDPDYVVIGETVNYNFENISIATKLVERGARLIGTNSDLTCPVENGIVPACRALMAPIEMTTGKKPYYIGKPNPLMMRTALKILGIHTSEAAMIGDRMDTDIIAGIESGMDSVLVLSGVTDLDTIEEYPFRPKYVLNGVGDIAIAD